MKQLKSTTWKMELKMATRKNFEGRVKTRREEALVRQAAYGKLTPEQKLAKAVPGSKEYSKLMSKVQK